MPSSGINQGAQALLSYNYGSKNYDRVMQTSKTLLRFQFLFFVPMTALLELFPEVFIRIFTSDAAVIKEASCMVRLYFHNPDTEGIQQITLSTGQEKDCLYMVIIRKLVLHYPADVHDKQNACSRSFRTDLGCSFGRCDCGLLCAGILSEDEKSGSFR